MTPGSTNALHSTRQLQLGVCLVPASDMVQAAAPLGLQIMKVTSKCFATQALRARQLGVNTVVVLEQIEELPLALEAAARLRVRPALGVRSRLATHHKCAAA